MTRKRVGLLTIALMLLATAAWVFAQGPGPGGPGGPGGGGRGRGMMGSMMYLERSWTAVSFQLDCTSEQLEALKPTYRNTLNARNEAIKTAMEAQDWQAIGKAMEDAKTRLEAKLKEVLTDAQLQKLDEIMMPRMGGMRPGGGGGGQ